SDVNPDRQDCDWMGLAGRIEDLQGSPVNGILIQSGGNLDGKLFDTQIQMSGTLGSAGGYEFTIADRPIASNGKLWVRLLDQQKYPLSEKIYFDTYDDCEKNLIMLYFRKIW
ncbi:MAG: hypothetical protein MUO76_22030, partial [Anaerolineaceae bacterium]|nr:hypothetical protein [Anaerolineaceae bacterium]